jgi:ArsR family transcriptional regulator, zinc-responsive transcriptional repressor
VAAKKPDLKELAMTFSHLSNSTRLTIIESLAEGAKNVTALGKITGERQPLVSHHLGLLRMAGIISAERRSREVYYTINVGALADVGEFLDSLAGD